MVRTMSWMENRQSVNLTCGDVCAGVVVLAVCLVLFFLLSHLSLDTQGNMHACWLQARPFRFSACSVLRPPCTLLVENVSQSSFSLFHSLGHETTKI